MNIGRMDRRIELHQATEAQSSSGAVVLTFALLETVAAEVLPLRGAETFGEGREQALATRQFRIRYRSDVTPKHRIVYETRTYDIERVEEIGRREGLQITARLVDA